MAPPPAVVSTVVPSRVGEVSVVGTPTLKNIVHDHEEVDCSVPPGGKKATSPVLYEDDETNSHGGATE